MDPDLRKTQIWEPCLPKGLHEFSWDAAFEAKSDLFQVWRAPFLYTTTELRLRKKAGVYNFLVYMQIGQKYTCFYTAMGVLRAPVRIEWCPSTKWCLIQAICTSNPNF